MEWYWQIAGYGIIFGLAAVAGLLMINIASLLSAALAAALAVMNKRGVEHYCQYNEKNIDKVKIILKPSQVYRIIERIFKCRLPHSQRGHQ